MLRRKIFQFIIYELFKHVDIKNTIIYVLLTSFYIVIENILRNIDQIKKRSYKKESDANYNIDFNSDYFSNTNNNHNNKNFKKTKNFRFLLNDFSNSRKINNQNINLNQKIKTKKLNQKLTLQLRFILFANKSIIFRIILIVLNTFKKMKFAIKRKKRKKFEFDINRYSIKLYKNKTKKQNVVNNNYYFNIC